MEITHYLAILDNDYVAKNNLQKAALLYFKSIDRLLIEKSQLNLFQKSILNSIEMINEENKRCKPLKIYFETGYPLRDDFIIRDIVIANFSLRSCKASDVPIFYKLQSNK